MVDNVVRLPHWVRLGSLGTGVAVCVLILVGTIVRLRDAGPGPTFSQFALLASMAFAFTALGVLLLVHLPSHRLSWLLTAIGIAAGVSVVSLSWPGWAPAAWVSQWSWWLPLGLIPLALLIFPDGKLPSRRWLPFAVVLATISGVAAIAFAAAALTGPQYLLFGEFGVRTEPARTLLRVAVLSVGLVLLGFLGVLGALIGRWRRSEGAVRSQLLFLATAGAVVVLGQLLDVIGVPVGWVAEGVALPLGMTLAILRYHLYDLDLYLNRVLVWVVLSLALVAGYVALVEVIGAAVTERRIQLVPIGVTVLVAVGFDPLRRLVQRGVDRLLFGRRDDPYGVISRLGRHLEEIVQPTAVLPRLVATITDSLQVPYAAVEVVGTSGRTSIAAAEGRHVIEPVPFPLTAHGHLVGTLLVSPRSTVDAFTDPEMKLLRDLARQAAVAVEACRLTLDLQQSREKLVTAREEERRTLRADLHDGVGPGLAGIALQVRAARKLLPTGERPATILDALAKDLELCGREIRTLVDQLRPASLDHGLVEALRLEGMRFTTDDFTVRLACQEELGELPAAVEVAAFRIAAESITNACRHASARSCTITVCRNDALEMRIADDGVGIQEDHRNGVGLASMRERAEELGGTLRLTVEVPRGTAVEVRLPLDLMDHL